jgi:hypothetical protein
MKQYSRRSLLKGAALPAAGIFALPSLARAIQETSTPQQRPKLKITDVRTAQVLVHGPQTHVRIYTDSAYAPKLIAPGHIGNRIERYPIPFYPAQSLRSGQHVMLPDPTGEDHSIQAAH